MTYQVSIGGFNTMITETIEDAKENALDIYDYNNGNARLINQVNVYDWQNGKPVLIGYVDEHGWHDVKSLDELMASN